MRFSVRNRRIEQLEQAVLGMQGDNGIERVEFHLLDAPDMAGAMPYVLFSSASSAGNEGYVLLTRSEADGKPLLVWEVGSEVTAAEGILKVQLRISGLERELWHSEITYFTVKGSLTVETPQPVVYRTRAAGASPGTLRTANPLSENPITISERTIHIPAELQNIAVQNDQYSETVTILCPATFDGHSLQSYSFFLRTTNSEGGYDPVALAPKPAGDGMLSMAWTLKPPQTSYSGKLSIQLWVTGKNFDWQTAEASVNIIRQLAGDPVIPITPPVMDEFLKEISVIANNAKASETNAANSAGAAANSANAAKAQAQAAANSAASAAQSERGAKAAQAGAETARQGAESAQAEAKGYSDLSKQYAEQADKRQKQAGGYRNEAAGFSQTAKDAVDSVAESAGAALASEAAAREEAERAAREADRSGAEADRSEEAADRAQDIANLWFKNPHTGQLDLLQNILTENFDFLFNLIRKLHNLGLTWRQINEKGLTWRQINALHLTWREINVLGITATKIADIRNTLMGR